MGIKMNKYYVYLHRRKDTGVVFYVGKGTGVRFRDGHDRSKSWIAIKESAGGFTHEIYRDNLTQDDSFELEKQLILNPEFDWNLVNEQPCEPIDYNRNWHELFIYDETSKSKLRWKKSKYKKRVGQEVGSYHMCGSTGYWNTTIDGRVHKIHRIIWVMFNGNLHKYDLINHIDNDCSNNSISNLELSDPMHNSCNTKRQVANLNNPNGYMKEHSSKHIVCGKEYIYYFAQVTIRRYGKKLSKSFSYIKCGSKEKAWELARTYRDAALISFDEANKIDFNKYYHEIKLNKDK